MSVIVTGSVATDYLMAFPGNFTDQLLPEHLDSLSLSFLVDDLAIRRGGAGANIAFNLGLLGLRPWLVAAVGQDFADYDSWLRRHGVDTTFLHTSGTRLTARFICTTDRTHKQLASFYSGAMAEARLIDLAPAVRQAGPGTLVIIGPNDPAAMLRHTAQCRDRGYRFAADPSQQLARMDGDDVRQLVDGAEYLFTNEYERGLLEHKTGLSGAQLDARVGVSVTTLGAKGVVLRRRGEPEIRVAAAPPRTETDPTGVGDAFRAGYLAGVEWGVGDERAAQLGCLMATLVLETVGTQEHRGERDDLLARFAQAYGAAAAEEIADRLGASTGPDGTEPRALAGRP
ncbi:carbohydrate kinase family protein [Rhizomonospora bruguierae]|uniref:carbohydrate kinase family protein n=1 Tax=Rhizomonospora bruguierae TaxID=1581705 RepID=UPI001BD01AB2|nr:carbohydrate kinase family protein [Micromonospora sp. NBRC 107566]